MENEQIKTNNKVHFIGSFHRFNFGSHQISIVFSVVTHLRALISETETRVRGTYYVLPSEETVNTIASSHLKIQWN